jgi:hypothetical protein
LDRFVNEQLTESRVGKAIEEFKKQAAELEPQVELEIIHHPVDPTLQTGESRLLGGAMEIRAPWSSLTESDAARHNDRND